MSELPLIHMVRPQAAALKVRIGPMVSYLVRLRERMIKVGFPMVDPLYQSVREAEVALRDLAVKTIAAKQVLETTRYC